VLLVTCAIACVALYIGAELFARWWIVRRKEYHVFAPGLRLRLHIDRDVLPELESIVRFDVNSDGERGGEVPRIGSGESLYRVLVVGGSQPEGYLLDQESCWPGALQRQLAAPRQLQRLGASKVHVGSIAKSGVGSEALDLLLTRVLPRYPRLQAIVILVGASDMLHWLEEGAPDRPASRTRVKNIFQCHPEGPFGWTPSTLAVTELLLRWRRRWLRPANRHEHAGRWVGGARAMRARARVVRTLPDPTAMLDHFETHLRRAIQRAQAHADRVLVVRQPWFEKDAYTPDEIAHFWHGGVGEAWREEVTTYYSIEVTCRLMALIDTRTSQVADQLGVEQLDLMPALERSLNTYYDFFHATPAGAGAVAKAVAAAVVHGRVAHDGLIERRFARCVDLRAS
jgi:lysophospholipase L1-like esterase